MRTLKVLIVAAVAAFGFGCGTDEADSNPCGSSPCFAGVTCSVAPSGQASCGPCPSGMMGDGFTCTPTTDPCMPSPCFAGVACSSDGNGGYACADCPAGYDGDGESCIDADGCAGAPCFAGVECTDVAAPGEGFACGDCPTGYDGDGIDCTDTDGCAIDPCFTGVACSDVPAPGVGFTCGACTVGLEGDGISCTEIDGCAGDPCLAGTDCTDVPAPGTGFGCSVCMGAACPILTAQAGPDETIAGGESLILNGSATGFNGSFSCEWANDQDATTIGTCSATVTPAADTTYTLTVTDASGLTASDDKRVSVVVLRAEAGPDVNIILGEDATLSASWAGATCSDSSCISCSWALTDGTVVASTCDTVVSPTFTMGYVLTVTDSGNNETAMDNVSVYVTDVEAQLCGWNVVVLNHTPFSVNPDPNYICDASGTARRQIANARAAIVLSDLVVSNTKIVGHIGVETGSDDDLIGVIWGWRSPQHMYMLKWKQANQVHPGCGNGMAGIGVTKVDGSTTAAEGITLDPVSGFLTTDHVFPCATMWSTDRNDVGLLDPGTTYLHSPRDMGASTVGWVDFTTYRIELFYTPTQTKVLVYEDDMMTGSTDNLITEFVVQDSSYPSGQFAFYTASQEQVEFGDFTIATLSAYRADAGPDQMVTQASNAATLQGTATLAVPPYTCGWSDGLSTISGDCTTDVMPTQTTTYELTVTDAFGRVASDSVTVEVTN